MKSTSKITQSAHILNKMVPGTSGLQSSPLASYDKPFKHPSACCDGQDDLKSTQRNAVYNMRLYPI